MYQIDHTKTELENFQAMVNQGIQFPLKADEYTRGLPVVITPSDDNGQSNTSIVVTPVTPLLPNDMSTIYYTRRSLAENRPTAGTKVFCGNADSHADIHAKIIEAQRLVASEVTFTDPERTPVGGESVPYTVTVVANSKIYLPGTLVYHAFNLDEAVAPFPPSYLFGNKTSDRSGFPAYSAATALDILVNGDPALTSPQVFLRYLNSLITKDTKGTSFTEATVTTVGGAELGGSNTALTYVLVTPGVGAPVATPFYLLYARDNLVDRGGANGVGAMPGGTEMMDSTDFPTFLARLKVVFKIPTDFLGGQIAQGPTFTLNSKQVSGPGGAWLQSSQAMYASNRFQTIVFNR